MFPAAVILPLATAPLRAAACTKSRSPTARAATPPAIPSLLAAVRFPPCLRVRAAPLPCSPPDDPRSADNRLPLASSDVRAPPALPLPGRTHARPPSPTTPAPPRASNRSERRPYQTAAHCKQSEAWKKFSSDFPGGQNMILES